MIERERKLRIDGDAIANCPWDSKETIWQGYFLTGEREVRIRQTDHPKFILGLKIDITEDIRKEIAIPVTEDIAQEIFTICQGSVIEKVRYHAGRWEIDSYKGHLLGLFVAEIELDVGEPIPDIPVWLQPHVLEDVTDDYRYKNAYLARHGKPASLMVP